MALERVSFRTGPFREGPTLRTQKTPGEDFPNGDEREPEAKNVLRETFAKANLPAEIEVYSGAHGWCPPDSRVYNEPLAEKAWSRLLELYGKGLA